MEGQRLSYVRILGLVLLVAMVPMTAQGQAKDSIVTKTDSTVTTTTVTTTVTSDSTVRTDTVKVVRRPKTADEYLFWNLNHSAFLGAAFDKVFRAASNSLLVMAIVVPVSLVVGGVAFANTHNVGLWASNGISIAVGAGVTIGLQELILKPLMHRERPYRALDSVLVYDSSAVGYSFPSSHAAMSWGLAVGLSLRYPQWYVVAPSFLYAAIVTISRPRLGVHYPTDVLAGAIVGSLVQYGMYRFQYWPRTARASTGSYFHSASARLQPIGLSFRLPLGN